MDKKHLMRKAFDLAKKGKNLTGLNPMVGAIILTYRKRENVKTQSYIKQISRDKSSAVILKDVEFNKGVKIDD